MTTPHDLIERLRHLAATLDKLALAEGAWPSDRNRRLKAGHEMRASLRAFNAPPKSTVEEERPDVDLTEAQRLEATRVRHALQKLRQSEHAQDLKALLTTAIDLTQGLAGDATLADVAATESTTKAADTRQRSAAQRAEAVQARAQNTRRPVRRGLV